MFIFSLFFKLIQMGNSAFVFKPDNIYYFLFAGILSSFLSCNEDKSKSQKNSSVTPEVNERKTKQAWPFLTYIDSVSKLPEAKFNEAGILSLNKRFLSRLPLVMHDSIKGDNRKDIVIQYYRSKEYPKVGSGIIFLIPEAIADSLVVSDFTNYFGSIKSEKTHIGITAQPLPVYITVSSERSIKLTLNNNENQSQAAVTTVEVLDY